MIYVGIFAVMILACYLCRNSWQRADALYYLLLVTLFLFTAFRFKVGCDWMGYLLQYMLQGTRMAVDAWAGHREPLWWWALELQQRLDLPYPWINVFSAALFFGGVHALARCQPNRLAFLVLLYPVLILNIAMSGIRQAAATGLICAAFAALVRQRSVRFAVLNGVAALLHFSSLIFLVLLPLVRGQITRWRIVATGILAIAGGFYLSSAETVEEAVNNYVASGVDAAGGMFRVGVLVITAILFLRVLRPAWQERYPADYTLVLVGSLMMLALAPIVAISSVIGDRYAYYLYPIQAIIVARIPYLDLGGRERRYTVMAWGGLLSLLVVWVSASALFQQCYLPYRSWLFGMPLESMALD